MPYALLLFFILKTSLLFGNQTPKREFRAAWIATIYNIDWPSQKGLSKDIQKQELINILDMLKTMKFNAAILQIKPTSDAFYNSKLSPWSQYLTGTQGKDPGYDPLQFFITEAHKRCLEIHVWINPFRIANKKEIYTLSKNHIAKKNPGWTISYDDRLYFDPGNINAQNYIIKEIMEIIKKYNIDALHIDDYFYPYKAYKNKAVIPFHDDKSWKKYKKKFPNRDDWRRNNINRFVEKISIEIKKEKPYVQFGISPFGIWRNKYEDTRGSDTAKKNTSSYSDNYADVVTWIDHGWVDYIIPQIYWDFNCKYAPFPVLADWWNKTVGDKANLYIGIGIYKLNNEKWPLNSINQQIDYIRNLSYVDGFSYYSAIWLMKNTKNIFTDNKNMLYKNEALIPINKKIKEYPSLTPENFRLEYKNKKYILTWTNKDTKNTRYYVIYRFLKNSNPDISNSENILAKIAAGIPLEFILEDHDNKYTYGITGVSRNHRESALMLVKRSY